MPEERPIRILNIDDDEAKRYSVSRVLQRAGFEIDEAETGADGLRLARELTPDLIVLDVRLPDLSGLEVCRLLKADDATAAIPVLQLSAVAVRSTDRVEGLNSGADGYLAEPVDTGELLATVNALLRVRRAEEQARELLHREQALREEAEQQAEQLQSLNEELQVANEELQIQHERMRELNDSLDLQNRRSALLAEASRILASSLEYEATIEHVARLLVPELGDWCAVELADGALLPGDRPAPLRLVTAVHTTAAREEQLRSRLAALAQVACDSSMPQAVAHTGKPRLVPVLHSGATSYLQSLGDLGVQALICAPLVARGRAFGAMTFANLDPRRDFGDDDLLLVEEIARRVATTIDNIRLYRDLQAADARKDDFLAMLGHELRNPLGAVSNSLRVLRSPDADGEARGRALEVLERQVKHQVRLVDDLLDVSRITRGKILLRRVPLDLATLVRDTTDDHRRAMDASGLALHVELPEGAVPVSGDPTRLSQVLGNLLQNSEKFTEPGGSITVRLTVDESRRRAELRVSDTGIGITPEALPRVFDIFSQSDRSLDRSRGGLGLGLALVKELAALHGGEVSARSEGLGRGAAFTVTLPLRQAESEHHDEIPETRSGPATSVTPDTNPASTRAAARVLIIEDNRDAAETLRDLLELTGYEVRAAYAGPSGVEAAAEFLPHAVVCDLGLPGMDGFEVAQALRGSPATRGVRLIALSGYGQEDDRRRSREAGFDVHLVKPVDPEELQRVLAG